MLKFILASSSPRRIEILKNLGMEFEVIPSDFDEVSDIEDEVELVKFFAKEKALDVSNKVDDNSIVIAADTIVCKNGIVMGKPKSPEEAFETIKKLCNTHHEVITGLCVINKQKGLIVTDVEITKVFFNNMSEDEILSYVATKEPMDKAGSYGIQGMGSVFVNRIEGCYFNVVGLPVSRLYNVLRGMGINLLVKE